FSWPGYPSVRSIVAKDNYTIVVTLKKKDSNWTYVPAGFGWIFEKKAADACGNDFAKPSCMLVGTGPWKFDSLDPTSGMELSANPHWWGGKVPIQHISVKVITDPTAQALAFRAGDIDVIPFVGNPTLFASVAGTQPTIKPGCGFWYLAGVVKSSGPWA